MPEHRMELSSPSSGKVFVFSGEGVLFAFGEVVCVFGTPPRTEQEANKQTNKQTRKQTTWIGLLTLVSL
jgi:hypothetical protein